MVAVGQECVKWLNHSNFVYARKLSLDRILYPNPFGRFYIKDLTARFRYYSGEGWRTLFFKRSISNGIWQAYIDFFFSVVFRKWRLPFPVGSPVCLYWFC
jgi:hypothetical protein